MSEHLVDIKRPYRRKGQKGRSLPVYFFPEDIDVLETLKTLTSLDRSAAIRAAIRLFLLQLNDGATEEEGV